MVSQFLTLHSPLGIFTLFTKAVFITVVSIVIMPLAFKIAFIYLCIYSFIIYLVVDCSFACLLVFFFLFLPRLSTSSASTLILPLILKGKLKYTGQIQDQNTPDSLQVSNHFAL